jgi:nucleoside-diphosphate-sugar epimerase
MIVLVTGGGSPLADALARQLARQGHAVRLAGAELQSAQSAADLEAEGIGWWPVPDGVLGADEATAELVAGVDTIVHAEPALHAALGPDDFGWLDACTRGVYNLLTAAAAAGVGRCVLLGTMDVFLAYPRDVGVLARYAPRPTADAAALGPHLAAFTGREFALCGALRVLVARLGTVVATPPAAGKAASRWWVTADEAAQVLAAEVAAPAAEDFGFVPAYANYSCVNIGRGERDGRETEAGWWRRANCGDPSWVPPPPPPASAPPPAEGVPGVQKVLILGGSGMLGPDIARVLAGDVADHGGDPARAYALRITDVVDRPTRRDEAQVQRQGNAGTPASPPPDAATDPRHEYLSCDITSAAEVAAAMAGTDVAVICSVVRAHAMLSFHVNCIGVWVAARAALACGHQRLVNTGPKEVLAGQQFEAHHRLTEDGPPQSGLGLYAFTKGLGHEVTRVVAATTGLYVMTTLHGNFEMARVARRARSRCRFVPPPIHFIPDSLTYSVPLFVKRQCDRTLGVGGPRGGGRPRAGHHLDL